MHVQIKKLLLLLGLLTWPVYIFCLGNDLRIERHDLLADLAITDQDRIMQIDKVDSNRPKLSNLFKNIQLGANPNQRNESMNIVIRLASPPVGKSGAKSDQEKDDYKTAILREQNETVARLGRLVPEMEVIAKTHLVMNAIFVKVPTSSLHILSNDASVTRIAPVGEYRLDLSETVPFIGGDIVHTRGYNGTGVKVAVVDSGIDYTHKNLGGEGTMVAFEKAYGTNMTDNHTRRDDLFPTEKVVEGYDFVGELWPFNNGTLDPDDDPIDIEGHGTHVADIIAGKRGVAPGATLVAIKVCSAVDSICNGIALIQAVEYAIEQEVDIINLSLGGSYGQPFDDDLSYALKGAHDDFGIMVVASAGNCGDNPYCTGTPAAEATALSVAQTTMPSWYTPQIAVNDNDYAAAFFTWSVALVNETLSGPLIYPDGSNTNTLGCEAFLPGSLNGYIVLVDRGTCTFTTKVLNIENAGGIGAIIGNNIPGEKPFAGGFSGDEHPSIPGYMIGAEDASQIKLDFMKAMLSNSTNNITAIFDPSNKVKLASNETASTSARGPDMSFNRIKPEIGAPGQSLSAVAGSGDGEQYFGGTSGAGPMVAGAAALIKQSCPDCTPLQIKTLLMNTADRDTISDTTGNSAEISRIGAGIVRVDKALATPILAYSPDDNQPSLSLGLVDAADDVFISRKIIITNRQTETLELTVTPTFRLKAKEESGAIQIQILIESQPVNDTRIILPGNNDIEVEIAFLLNADKLPSNAMSSGRHGTDPSSLAANEFDGYIVIAIATNAITHNDENTYDIALPWHTLARKAAKVTAARTTLLPPSSLGKTELHSDTITITNEGAGVAQIDTFDLLAISDEKERGAQGEQKPTPDIRAVGYRTLLSPICVESGWAFQFAVNTWRRQTHLLPVTFVFDFDVDGDGYYETQMYNSALGGIDDARIVTYTIVSPPPSPIGPDNMNDGNDTATETPIVNPMPVANFFVSHGTNTGNTVLTICGEQLGLSKMSDLLSQNIVISGRASSIDSYNGGPGDYQAANFTVTPFGERFTIDTGSGWARLRNATQMDLAPGASGDLIVYDMGIPYFVKRNNATGNSGSYGMMIITNGYRGENDNGAATKDSELMLLLSQGVEGPQELVLEGQHDQDQDQEQVGGTGTITSETRSRSRSASHDDSNTRSSKSTSNSNISSKSSKSSSSDSKAPGSGLRLRRGRHLRGFSS